MEETKEKKGFCSDWLRDKVSSGLQVSEDVTILSQALREANAAKIINSKRVIQQSCREQPPTPNNGNSRVRLNVPPPPERRNEAAGRSRTGSQQAERGQIAVANLSPNFVPNVSANSVPPGPTARGSAGASVMGPRNPTPTPVMQQMFLVHLAFLRVMEREILLLIPIVPRRLIVIL
ncbi:hypothetical protein COLO4_37687 [Corchorus olitorius]|uniref:Uncharacterized protein n=1 Tax=Corchorus olitorius TaxID=93759 RepID=A0A1R3G015_9ROSI|nr:hypothetical protein COLO4_37687 [Corchorus olitorius]